MRNRLMMLDCGAAAGLRPRLAQAADAADQGRPPPARCPAQGLADVGVAAGGEHRWRRSPLRAVPRPASGRGDLARMDTEHGALPLQCEQRRTSVIATQRYTATYYTGKLVVSGVFDSIPLNYRYDANVVLDHRRSRAIHLAR